MNNFAAEKIANLNNIFNYETDKNFLQDISMLSACHSGKQGVC
jgi:hypothetical protein